MALAFLSLMETLDPGTDRMAKLVASTNAGLSYYSRAEEWQGLVPIGVDDTTRSLRTL